MQLRDGKKITDMELPFIEKIALKEVLKKIQGTDIEKFLKEYNAICCEQSRWRGAWLRAFLRGGRWGKNTGGFAPGPENSHSRAVLCLWQTRSLRFSISAMLNPAQRAHGFNSPKEPEVPVLPIFMIALQS